MVPFFLPTIRYLSLMALQRMGSAMVSLLMTKVSGLCAVVNEVLLMSNMRTFEADMRAGDEESEASL